MDDVRRQEPDIAVDLPDMPARVPVTGTEFIEFASRGTERDALESLLSSMGFRRIGRHIAKDLVLWQQGDIRIVVNSEETGHADAAYVAHGTTVCDLGISVASATETLARAKALGTQPFHQPVGPGELDIPAIRGLSGSVLHFFDRHSGLEDVWSVEFTELPDAAEVPDAGLTRVDHIAQTMSYEEMLSWTLFYTALLDMAKAPMVDVIDPDGLVRSQALQTPDASLRITLNGAETHRTLAGGFLADSFGASVQHIALATDDIFQTAARLEKLGFGALPIPANYYDDLAARFDVAPELLARMKAANILYDADADGEFFQLYSRPYGGGMFFEILARRNGY